MSIRKRKALVVVLGDLARSPRMQYHCMSLASNNFQVTVIANGEGKGLGDKGCEELETNENIKQELMSNPPDFGSYLPRALAYIVKPIWQSLLLIYHLFLVPVPYVIIVQNPPSIPTLPILYLYSKITNSGFIIDWHNYGYSILSLNLKPSHPFVRISKWIEIFFGRLADAGFCVSKAMWTDLRENHKISYPLHVLFDKPPKHFKPLNLRERHNLFLKLKEDIPAFRWPTNDCFGARPATPSDRLETRFTMTDVINENVVMSRPNRPAIIMSSTSWTPDEDFGLLLAALKRYDLARTTQLLEDIHPDDIKSCLPPLVCVITGKGPMKSKYEDEIKQAKLKHIEVTLPWLSAGDYAKMVASCDLGISLHSSSSGVDLPMKVVDMFGCGIPVLAYKYPAIGELVNEDYYGLTFEGPEDLFLKIAMMVKDLHNQSSLLNKYKKNIKRHFLLFRWEDNWDSIAKPAIDDLW